MKVRRKSLWRRHNNKTAKKRANQRAAKERQRTAAALVEAEGLAVVDVPAPKLPRSGFRVTVECLDDGQRASFTTLRTPFGLTVSPTLAGRKVATVLRLYQALPTRLTNRRVNECPRRENSLSTCF